jgi:hypothetical protein
MKTQREKVRDFLSDPAHVSIGLREAARRLGMPESTFRSAKAAIIHETTNGDTMSKASSRAVVLLTEDESAALAECEAVIEAGLQTFYEVGTALLTIRNERLYRASHKTFDEYCRERWGFNSSRARQLVDSAKVLENLKSVTAVTLPESEWQSRPLTRLEPEQQQEAWQKAVASSEDGKPTAKQVEEAAQAVAPKPVNGKSRVNGHLTDDPPDVAAARAAGKISPDVVVEVTDPGETPSAESVREEHEERESIASEGQSDEEWLATLPLRAVLDGVPLKTFEEDALAFRSLASARKTYAHHANRVLKSLRRRGAFVARVRSFLTIEAPEKWVVCAAPEHGGCGGMGQIPLIGNCSKCYGRGYRING